MNTTLHFRIRNNGFGVPAGGTEEVRAVSTADGFKIISAPFFIENLSVDDEIEAQTDSTNTVVSWKQKNESSRSVVWVFGADARRRAPILTEVASIGCTFSVHERLDLVAIDVPGPVEIAKLDEYVARLGEIGGFFHYASLRHQG